MPIEQQSEKIRFPQMPLAMYREVAAHLRQVKGVETALLAQTAQQFEYQQSQVEGLWVCYRVPLEEKHKYLVEEILDYYAQRHGAWQRT